MRLIGSVSMVLLISATGMLAQGSAPVERRAVLVELFTSEGCSSCPPADALLARINGQLIDPNLMIVGISEHVTYWNQLGWADPFSQQQFTERQNEYGSRLGLDSVYTPQMIVNGGAQFVGSDEAALKRALRAAKDPSPVGLHIVSISPGADGLSVTFAVAGPVASADVYAVLADDMHRSNVQRGENSGRTLAHVSVARTMTRVAKVKAPGTMTVTIPDSGKGAAPRHLILFLQQPRQGKVLAAESTPISVQSRENGQMIAQKLP